MWQTLVNLVLSILHDDPRYEGQTEESLLDWVIGHGYPGAPSPHQSTRDLIYVYAANLLNSGARGPNAQAFAQMIAAGTRHFIHQNAVRPMELRALARHCAAYLDETGEQLVGRTDRNPVYRREIQQLADGAVLQRGLMLPRLMQSVVQFVRLLNEPHYGGQAANFHSPFMHRHDAVVPNPFPQNKLREIIDFPQVGVAVGMNFLKDSQLSAFAPDGRSVRQRFEDLGNCHVGWFVKPDMHVLRLMLYATGRAANLGIGSDAISTLDAKQLEQLQLRYAEGRPGAHMGSNYEYQLHRGWPDEGGLWRCIEDVQRLAQASGIAPVGIDRLLYLIGSGNFQSQEARLTVSQSERYRRFVDAIDPLFGARRDAFTSRTVPTPASCVAPPIVNEPLRPQGADSGDSMTPYPQWADGKTPKTHPQARPQAWRPVQNATVIHVKGATYRGSREITGTFQLADSEQGPVAHAGKLRVEVLCSWFGVKPPTTFPKLVVQPGDFRVESGFSGDVVDDIAK
ncbi:hypothetical protein FN976_19625 [Caenimonas sedimenti]|uniref:Uncharacterized protein n=1 Tax=Caenimonas sedimenti TaxID=2596921 RepID=A0A562ZM57_9BURK|nr:hypothetical protein [Caenimonas sedimenti]TWO69497.1 hypothetical protein FN976_19625 [Caenimonas sedimenti]